MIRLNLNFNQINKSPLYSNLVWLAGSHGFNLVLPLFIYPYLIRIIGIENFGLVMFAQATVMYFVNFVDYGFSLSGIREVSVNRHNKEKLNSIFSEVFFTKLFLLIIAMVLFAILILLIPKWRDNYLLFSTSYFIVIGQWLLPFWFLQGLEKMKIMSVLNILSKISFLILVVLLISREANYLYVNFWLGLSQFLFGVVGIIILYLHFNVKLHWPTFNIILKHIRSNFILFTSNFSAFVSSNSNLVVLAFIADPISIGYFAIVERILVAIKAPAVLLYQTVYPRLCSVAEQSQERLITFSRQIVRYVYLFFIPVAIITCVFAHQIVTLFAGQLIKEPVHLLYIVSTIPLIVALNIPPTQTLLAYKHHRTYAIITISGGVLNLILNLILIKLFLATGAAMTALITELCVTTLIYITISSKYKDYSSLRVLNWV